MATKSRAAAAPVKAKAVKAGAASAAKKSAAPAVKAARKSAAKAPARPAVKPAAKAAPPRPPARTRASGTAAALKRAAKLVAAKPVPQAGVNPKLVRDSFTMPENEYAVLAAVKQSCLKAGIDVKKSELLRIGVALVGQVGLPALQAMLASLPQLKTGRPRTGPAG